MDRRLATIALLWALGCGPAVSAGGGTSSTTGEPKDTSTAGPAVTTSTSSTSTPEPETTVATETGGITDVPLESCPCSFLCPLCAPYGCAEYDPWCSETFECDVRGQDCPYGEKCMPWANDGGPAWNATRCTPLDPAPSQLGEACSVVGGPATGIDSCGLSQICFEGTCVAFCEGELESPSCPAGQACSSTNEGTLAICLPSCDPLQQTCAEGEGCFPAIADTFVCLPAPTQAIVSPSTCHLSGGCEPGTICRASETVPGCADEGGCCTPYCDLTDAACPPDSACVPFFARGTAPQGLEDVGVCGLPGP